MFMFIGGGGIVCMGWVFEVGLFRFFLGKVK